MSLRLAHDWVWDSWPFTDEAGKHHLFHLKAPRSLLDPQLRHSNPRIGHAVSTDWRNWDILPDALAPTTTSESWDDLTTWTGSVVRGPDRYHLFYTGGSRAQGYMVQRIGRADSDDLIHWERFGDQPLVTADSRWYESVDGCTGHEQHWRDPWVYADPSGNGWHMLITARLPGSERGRGVVAHATSTDLTVWTVQPPLTKPGPFDQLEVVQTVTVDGKHYLLASCGDGELNPDHHRLGAAGGVYLLPGASAIGPWDASQAVRIGPDELYAARMIDDRGAPALLGFTDIADGKFVGEIPDPIPVLPGEHSFDTSGI